MKRRKFIQNTMAVSSASLLGSSTLLGCNSTPGSENQDEKNMVSLKNNIHHSVCQWCYSKYPLDDLLPKLKAMGIYAIDLIGEKDWPTLKKHEVHCSMCNGAEINLVDGWNEPKFHEELIANYSRTIPLVAEAGYKNLICFSGNRRGMSDEEGMANCVTGLKQILPLAEKHGVIIQMELFNSKVDHKDYMCDNTPWGMKLCDQLGSENFKLLYDIYHMQINEGDIIRTIKDFHPYFGHYHTAGVPGRHEIDDLQELYYPAIMKAILETGFEGYVAQEFIPTREDDLAALEEAIQICDV